MQRYPFKVRKVVFQKLEEIVDIVSNLSMHFDEHK